MGCDNAWHLCAITSAKNSHERRTHSRQVSRLQNSKIPEHLADPPVHTDCNRNSWRMKQPSKRINHRTWETYHHYHRRNKRDKLYLSASLSGNSERQHAVFHWVFHHRHGLNTKNNSRNNISILRTLALVITRDSVLKMLQWQKTLNIFFFPLAFDFPRFSMHFCCCYNNNYNNKNNNNNNNNNNSNSNKK